MERSATTWSASAVSVEMRHLRVWVSSRKRLDVIFSTAKPQIPWPLPEGPRGALCMVYRPSPLAAIKSSPFV